jgi:hypothetical protein
MYVDHSSGLALSARGDSKLLRSVPQALPSVVARSSSFAGDVSTTSRVRALNMVTGLSHAKFMGASSDTYSAEGATGNHIDPPSPPGDSSASSTVLCLIARLLTKIWCSAAQAT